MNKNIIYAVIGILLVSCLYLLYLNYKLKQSNNNLENKLIKNNKNHLDNSPPKLNPDNKDLKEYDTVKESKVLNDDKASNEKTSQSNSHIKVNESENINLSNEYSKYKDNIHDYYIDETIPEELKTEIDNLSNNVSKDSLDEPVDENAEEPVDENAEEPVDENAEEPVDENAEEPVDESDEEYDEEPVGNLVNEFAEEFVDEILENPIEMSNIKDENLNKSLEENNNQLEYAENYLNQFSNTKLVREELVKLSLKKLKQIAREKNLLLKGTKNELIERLILN